MPMTVTIAISMFYVLLCVKNKINLYLLVCTHYAVIHFFKRKTVNE